MKKKATIKQPQYKYDHRTSKSFHLLPEVDALLTALVAEAQANRQDVFEVFIRRAASASPQEKEALGREAREANQKNYVNRCVARLAHARA